MTHSNSIIIKWQHDNISFPNFKTFTLTIQSNLKTLPKHSIWFYVGFICWVQVVNLKTVSKHRWSSHLCVFIASIRRGDRESESRRETRRVAWKYWFIGILSWGSRLPIIESPIRRRGRKDQRNKEQEGERRRARDSKGENESIPQVRGKVV